MWHTYFDGAIAGTLLTVVWRWRWWLQCAHGWKEQWELASRQLAVKDTHCERLLSENTQLHARLQIIGRELRCALTELNSVQQQLKVLRGDKTHGTPGGAVVGLFAMRAEKAAGVVSARREGQSGPATAGESVSGVPTPP